MTKIFKIEYAHILRGSFTLLFRSYKMEVRLDYITESLRLAPTYSIIWKVSYKYWIKDYYKLF